MQRNTLARAMYAYLAAYVAACAIWSPSSAAAVMVMLDGDWGIAAVAATVLLAVLIGLDVLPDRYSLRWVKRHRQYLYWLTAVFYIMPVFATSGRFENVAQVIFYLGMAAFGMVLAYLEVRNVKGAPCGD